MDGETLCCLCDGHDHHSFLESTDWSRLTTKEIGILCDNAVSRCLVTDIGACRGHLVALSSSLDIERGLSTVVVKPAHKFLPASLLQRYYS